MESLTHNLSPAEGFSFEQAVEGSRFEHRYQVEPLVYGQFRNAFHDESPIHTDENFARAHGFDGRVMHGGILNGFLSHFIGMIYPAKHGMLLHSELFFQSPVYLNDQLRLSVKITQRSEAKRVLVLSLLFNNETQGRLCARGRAQVLIHAGR